MTTRLINPDGLTFIQRWEGLELVAYKDLAGVWTIGWGHTGGVYKGQVITEAEATQLLIRDLSTAEDFVNARGLSSDNQFAAMVSLTFTIGTGAFLGSTVLHQHKAGNFEAAADAFLLWDKAHINGKLVVVPDLLNRRIDERALYLRGGGTEGVAGQSLVMGQRRSLRCIAAVIDWRTWLISLLRV
jgi:lysozyme